MKYDVEINNKTVVNSMFWKLLERFFAEGINLVVQIILARLLLPEDFGYLAIIVAVVNYAAQFVHSGLATALVQKKDLEDLDISTLLSASLSVAAVFYIGLFFAAPAIMAYYETPTLLWPFRAQTAILFLNAITAIQTAVLSRQMRFKTLFIRSAIAIPISGAIGIGMAYMGFGIWALVAQSLSNALLVVLVMSIGSGLRFSLRFSWSHAKKLYAFSSKILLTTLVSGFGDFFRTMTIGKKYTSSDLGYYNKAYSYSGYITNVVNASITSVLLPTFSRKQTDPDALKAMARKSVRLTSFFMFPVLAGIFAIARPLVLVLLTEKWAEIIPFLMVFCILRAPGCLLAVDKQVYYALGHSEISFYYGIGFLAANLASLFITLPISALAIAIGATIIEVFGCCVYFVISSKVYRYRLAERLFDLWRPLLNSVLMALVLLVFSLLKISNLWLLICSIPLGIAIYIGLSILTRDPSVSDIIIILQSKLKTSKSTLNKIFKVLQKKHS